jgi:hypothetical protein
MSAWPLRGGRPDEHDRDRVAEMCTLRGVSDPLVELSERLQETAYRLRSGSLETYATLELIEECARLASDASTDVDARVRAAVEPLPDLPGQLPLPTA